jgi:fatty-acyl-CoA synthase
MLRAFQRYPIRILAIEGERQYTYREVSDRVSLFGQALESLGLRPGDGVALLPVNSTEFLAAFIAVHISGFYYTPLHPFGSVNGHLRVITDSGVKAVLFVPSANPEYGAALAGALDGSIQMLTLGPCDAAGTTDLAAVAETFEIRCLQSTAEPSGIVSIMYTGGTSGNPKGTVVPEQSLAYDVFVHLAELDWPRPPMTVVTTPLSHGAVMLIGPTLLRGGTFILEKKFDVDRFLELVPRYHASVSFLVPTIIYKILDHPRIDDADLSSLRLVIYGGGPIASARLSEALERFGNIFAQIYGQTETQVATILSPEDHDLGRLHLLASAGRPVLGAKVTIRAEDGTIVPVGEVGEVCVKNPAVMRRYWKQPALTAEKLRDGWKYTGDMGYVDSEGYIYLVDRKEDLIISGGFNVYPAEVEGVLIRHPAVLSAAVYGVPHPKWGEAVHASVVLRRGAAVEVAELKRYVRAAKGPLSTPKEIRIVADLPLTTFGKIDRRELRRLSTDTY